MCWSKEGGRSNVTSRFLSVKLWRIRKLCRVNATLVTGHDIQDFTADKQAKLIIWAWYSAFTGTYGAISSAQKWKYIQANRRGPRTEPWGTPHSRSENTDIILLLVTRCVLFRKVRTGWRCAIGFHVWGGYCQKMKSHIDPVVEAQRWNTESVERKRLLWVM